MKPEEKVKTSDVERKSLPHVTLFHLKDLSQGDLLLLAMIAGGDYHDGIGQGGKAFAARIANVGAGPTLLAAARVAGAVGRKAAVEAWRRNTITALLATGVLQDAATATKLKCTPAFPSLDVLGYYVFPEVNRDPPPPPSRRIDLQALANLMSERLQ